MAPMACSFVCGKDKADQALICCASPDCDELLHVSCNEDWRLMQRCQLSDEVLNHERMCLGCLEMEMENEEESTLDDLLKGASSCDSAAAKPIASTGSSPSSSCSSSPASIHAPAERDAGSPKSATTDSTSTTASVSDLAPNPSPVSMSIEERHKQEKFQATSGTTAPFACRDEESGLFIVLANKVERASHISDGPAEVEIDTIVSMSRGVEFLVMQLLLVHATTSAGFQLFQDATGKATTIGWHAVIFNNAVGGKTWVVRTPAHSYLPPPVSSLHLLVCGSR
jgi:hypothetical protein